MAVTRMRFTGNGSGVHYIDLAKALSLQNRKLHRQKMIYTVYGGFFVDAAQGTGTSRVDLNTAPNTWVVKRAINRAFYYWRRMIAETVSNSQGVQTGKYNDFKIYLNNVHGISPLLPKDADGHDLFTVASDVGWDYSTMTTADPYEDGSGVTAPADQFSLMIVGPTVPLVPTPGDITRVGVVQSWLDTRPQPQEDEPLMPTEANSDPLANLFDAGDVDDDRIQVIEDEGDDPPYDPNDVFGNCQTSGAENNLQRQSVAVTTSTAHVAHVHGFEAICGLVEVNVVRADGDWELVLDVESKGVKF